MPGATVHTRSDSRTSVADWLAYARTDPAAVHREWAERRVAMLPLGTHFDAVRLPTDVLHAALGTDNQDAIRHVLPGLLAGPVIHDGDAWLYALVEPGSPAPRPTRVRRCLGIGEHLPVPRVDQLGPPGLHWVVAPDTPGRLCARALVDELVAVGAARLAEREHG